MKKHARIVFMYTIITVWSFNIYAMDNDTHEAEHDRANMPVDPQENIVHLQEQYNILDTEYRAMQAINTHLQANAKTHEEKIQNLTENITNQEKTIQDLTIKIKSITNSKESYENALNTKKAELTEQEKEFNTLKATSNKITTQLESQLTAEKEKVEQVQKNYKTLQEQLKKEEEELRRLNEELTSEINAKQTVLSVNQHLLKKIGFNPGQDVSMLFTHTIDVQTLSRNKKLLCHLLGFTIGGFATYGLLAATGYLPSDARIAAGLFALGASSGLYAGGKLSHAINGRSTITTTVNPKAYVQLRGDIKNGYTPTFGIQE